jgi:hypothetical protein
MNEGETSRSIKLGIVIEALKHEEREECAKIAEVFTLLVTTPDQTT